jgi:MFS family permease
MIIGISTLVTVLGTISGPIVAGAFADSYGNYRYGFTLLAILAGVGSLFFLIAKKPKIPKIPKIPKST